MYKNNTCSVHYCQYESSVCLFLNTLFINYSVHFLHPMFIHFQITSSYSSRSSSSCLWTSNFSRYAFTATPNQKSCFPQAWGKPSCAKGLRWDYFRCASAQKMYPTLTLKLFGTNIVLHELWHRCLIYINFRSHFEGYLQDSCLINRSESGS